jgi:hypothetical protein
MLCIFINIQKINSFENLFLLQFIWGREKHSDKPHAILVNSITNQNMNLSSDKPHAILVNSITNQNMNLSSDKPHAILVNSISNQNMNLSSDKPPLLRQTSCNIGQQYIQPKHEPLLRQTSCNIGQQYSQPKHEPLLKPHTILIKNYDHSSNKPLKHRNDKIRSQLKSRCWPNGPGTEMWQG